MRSPRANHVPKYIRTRKVVYERFRRTIFITTPLLLSFFFFFLIGKQWIYINTFVVGHAQANILLRPLTP